MASARIHIASLPATRCRERVRSTAYDAIPQSPTSNRATPMMISQMDRGNCGIRLAGRATALGSRWLPVHLRAGGGILAARIPLEEDHRHDDVEDKPTRDPHDERAQ